LGLGSPKRGIKRDQNKGGEEEKREKLQTGERALFAEGGGGEDSLRRQGNGGAAKNVHKGPERTRAQRHARTQAWPKNPGREELDDPAGQEGASRPKSSPLAVRREPKENLPIKRGQDASREMTTAEARHGGDRNVEDFAGRIVGRI